MASFTGVGDSTELFVNVRGEVVEIDISGTYDMTILFQREQGAKGSGAWDTIRSYSTADATVAETYTTVRDNENLRLIVDIDTSGTATATLSDTVKSVQKIQDRQGATMMEYFQGHVVPTNTPVDLGTSDITLTRQTHANRVLLINDAAGFDATLPAATGSGDVYKFFVKTTVTSNDVTIKAANANDTMSGLAIIAQDGGDEVQAFETAAASDAVQLNGTTQGGIVGDFIELVDVDSNKWWVRAMLSATGTEASPFKAEVA